MAYQVEETGAHSRKVQVTVPAEDFEQEMNKTLRKLSKRVKISGFRKGKIPLSVMRRHYGQSVKGDVIENLLREHIDQVLSAQEQVIYLSQPAIKQLPKGKAPLEFEVDVEVRPELDPVGYMGLSVERPKAEISQEEIDERIEALRGEHAALEPIEGRDTIEAGDIVDLDFKALGDGPGLDQLSGQDVQIEVGSGQALAGIEDALEGAKFDSTITTTLNLPEDFPIAEVADSDVELEITIKSVKARILPELDDEFAVDTGLGETLDEVKAKVSEQIAHQYEHQAQHMAEDNLVDVLLEQNPFELPPRFVLEQIDAQIMQQFQQMTGQQVDPRMVTGNESFDPMREDLRERVERQIRSEFLLMAIADKEKVKVSDEDFKAYCVHQAMHMDNVEPAALERFIRSDRDRLQQAMGSALLEKTLGILLGEASIVDVAWPEEVDEEDAAGGEEE